MSTEQDGALVWSIKQWINYVLYPTPNFNTHGSHGWREGHYILSTLTVNLKQPRTLFNII